MLKRLFAVICKRTPKNDYKFENVSSALFRPLGTAIGDAVILTASFKQLKTAFPDMKIGVIASKRSELVFKMCPLVDEIIPDSFFLAFKYRKKWQLFFDFMDCFSSRNLIYDKILSPDYLVCFEKRHKKYYNPLNLKTYDVYCPNTPPTHLSKWLLFTPIAKFIDVQNPEYVLSVPKSAPNPFTSSSKLTIFLVIEGTTRLLPLKPLQDLIRETIGNNISWVIANTTHANAYFDDLKTIQGANVSLAPKTNLSEFISYIYFADAVMSIDTSASHIACAFHKPLIALYSNSTKNLTKLQPLQYVNSILVTPEKAVQNSDDYSDFTAQDILVKTAEFLKYGGKSE